MRVVIQRAKTAKVEIAGEVVGELDRPGLVALVGVTHHDTEAEARRLAEKTWSLRILDDEQSASEMDAPILVVSQFTLYADTKKGRRPSWNKAAPAPISQPLVDYYIQALREQGARVCQGRFGADMQVSLVNDGPVTIILDTDEWATSRRH